MIDVFAWPLRQGKSQRRHSLSASSSTMPSSRPDCPRAPPGDAAIYTSHIKPSHIIRKVILRQIAIVNYVNPF